MVDFIYLSPSFVIFALVGVLRSWRYAIRAISAIAPSTTECQTENLVSAIELRRTFDHRPFGQHSRIAVDPWATRPHPLDNNAGNSTSIPSSFDSRDRYDEDDYAFPRTGEPLLEAFLSACQSFYVHAFGAATSALSSWLPTSVTVISAGSGF